MRAVQQPLCDMGLSIGDAVMTYAYNSGCPFTCSVALVVSHWGISDGLVLLFSDSHIENADSRGGMLVAAIGDALP